MDREKTMRERMARRLDRCVLPGRSWREELRRLALLCGALALISPLCFIAIREERDTLLRWSSHSQRVLMMDLRDLRGELKMAAFWPLARLYLLPLLLAAPLYLVVGAVRNVRSCRDGARSDYTLRRLRDPWEYPRRCLALPLLKALFCLALFALLTALYYAIYLHITPPELLLPGEQSFWGLGVEEPCYC